MKKITLITLLLIAACISSSCQNNNADKQLANSLKGTWQGSIFLDDEEIPADYQFFESTDGTTGKFVEIAYLHEIDGDFDVRYFSYACGEYTVKNGQLSLTFFPETTYAEPYNENDLEEYADALWAYYQEEGRKLLWENESELAVSILEMLEDEWAETCENRNASGNLFSNLTVTENKMDFVSGDQTWTFKRADFDWFTAYPFSE